MSTAIHITEGPCPLPEQGAPQSAGAQAVFIGRTRAETHIEHGPLVALDYDMHEPLVRNVLEQLAAEAIESHDALQVHIAHAKGVVPVGEASVVISAHSAHRAQAFDACRMLIDELKARAPIFKYERWTNAATWATGTPPPGAAN